MFEHPATDSHLDHGLNAFAYDAMPDQRHSLFVREAYGSFIRSTLAQWDALRAHYTFETFQGGDMYRNSADMLADVRERRHLWVLETEESQMDADHPMFAIVPDSQRVGSTALVSRVNDVFRAVHDLMGHAVSGGSFGLKGEMRAWLAHREMYPRTALPALWCETRGQASAFNMFHTDVPLSERPFPEQKAGVPPLFLV